MIQRKNFKLVVICLIMTMILNGCTKTTTTNPVPSTEVTSEPEQTFEISDEPEHTPEPIPEQTSEPTPEQTLEPTSTPKIIDTQNTEVTDGYDGDYYYGQLEEKQKVVFEMILANISVIQKEYIGFTGMTDKDIKKVIEAIILENYYYGSFSYSHYEENQVFFIKLEEQEEITEEQKLQVEQEVDQILETMKGDSQEEIIIQIYDWCASNIVYDDTKEMLNRSNLYGAFVERKCTCAGYAKAFAYLCKQKGIYSICVDNEEHMWNYVLFNDKWYAVDVTDAQEGTTRYLMQGKEILSEEGNVPGNYFAVPELAQKSLYPDEKKAKERIEYFNENLEICDKQLQKLEGYITSEENQGDYESKYKAIYDLYIEIKELLTEMLRKEDESIYHGYLNTEEYSEENKRLQTLIKRVNSYDW